MQGGKFVFHDAPQAGRDHAAPAFAGGPVAATVPGCVHTDLLAGNLIPDPYLDSNEEAVAWIGYTDWVYETVFDAPDAGPDAEAQRVDLVFGGLDTIASITLNGTEVGQTANMHRGYRFPVRDLLREHGNQLTITFTSACRYARAQRDALGALPGTLAEPFQRGTERIRRDHAGVGLGLAIVKSIAQAHDGTLGMVPRPDGGLCVTVRLPKAPPG